MNKLIIFKYENTKGKKLIRMNEVTRDVNYMERV